MLGKKGLFGESLTNIAFWIAFLIVAVIAVTLLVKRLTG
jgi:hypothetical protein